MKNMFVTTAAIGVLATFISPAQAAIDIDEATIQSGQVFIAGAQAPRRTAIFWEGAAVGKNTTPGGAFTFNTTNLPADCVGRLKIGTEERDVVINNCTPADITVIEAGVPKTGQTTSYAAGDDGDLEKGVAWPDPRFEDNGDGTVTDRLTGLIWLKDADCLGPLDWTDALTAVAGLADGSTEGCGLGDDSGLGDWRLPNRNELTSLLDLESFSRNLPSGHPFADFQGSSYWSSTSDWMFPNTFAWIVNFGSGNVLLDRKTNDSYVIAVRGGS